MKLPSLQAVRLPEEGLTVGELADLQLHRLAANVQTIGRDANKQAELQQSLKVGLLPGWHQPSGFRV